MCINIKCKLLRLSIELTVSLTANGGAQAPIAPCGIHTYPSLWKPRSMEAEKDNFRAGDPQ